MRYSLIPKLNPINFQEISQFSFKIKYTGPYTIYKALIESNILVGFRIKIKRQKKITLTQKLCKETTYIS
jgi:hypothetical protein